MNESKHTYVEPTKEEVSAFNKGIEALSNELELVLCPVPFIKDGKIDAQINLYKKVELVPKGSGVPSPYENGKNDNETTESTDEVA